VSSLWLLRFDRVMDAFTELKGLTKHVPASSWSVDYGILAERIHNMGRDFFHTGVITDMRAVHHIPRSDKTLAQVYDPKLFNEQKLDETESPLELAYKSLSKVLAMFPNCPLCGRNQPGHHAPDCNYLTIYDAVREERGEL
jgi:hypothetical protein